jgi:hypothetical protein
MDLENTNNEKPTDLTDEGKPAEGEREQHADKTQEMKIPGVTSALSAKNPRQEPEQKAVPEPAETSSSRYPKYRNLGCR